MKNENNGILIKLLQDIRHQAHDINNNTRMENNFILWSNYDRIKIKCVNKFEEYFDFNNQDPKWIGDIKYLQLFRSDNMICKVKDSLSLVFNDNNSKNLFISVKSNDNDCIAYNYFSIISIDINEKFDRENYDNFLRKINSVYKTDFDVYFESFYSLGNEDIVFILLSNQMDNIYRFLNLIRKSEFKTDGNNNQFICNYTYSLLGQNCIEREQFDLNFIEEKKFKAEILIKLKNGIENDNFVKKLKENININDEIIKDENISYLIGEYDLKIVLPQSKELLKEYFPGGCFNANDSCCEQNPDSFYDRYILYSKTNWYKSSIENNNSDETNILIEANNTNDISSIITEENSHSEIKGINEKIDELSCAIFNRITTNITLKSKLIFQEYQILLSKLQRFICTYSHSRWNKNILDTSKTLIKITEVVLENINIIDVEIFMQCLDDLIKSLRFAIDQIIKADEGIYDNSTSDSFYAGSFSKVLFAYHNFISFLFDFINLKPHESNTVQTKFSYFIRFVASSKIFSNVYLENNYADKKLIDFSFPYYALYDYEKYIPALLHEVAHYIAPVDRKKRNYYILQIFCSFFMKKILVSYLFDIINKNKGLFEKQELDVIIDYYLSECMEDFITVLISVLNNSDKNNLEFAEMDNLIKLLKELFGFKKTTTVHLDSFLNRTVEMLKRVSTEKNKLNFTDDINIETRVLIDKFIIEIKKINCNINTKNEEFTLYLDSTFLKFENIIMSVKEAICDNFMISVLGWNLNDYLCFMMDFFNDNNIVWYNDESIKIRFGILFDSMFAREYDSNKNLDTNTWINNSIKDEFLKNDINKIIQIYNEYGCQYYNYLKIFNELLYIDSFFLNIRDTENESIIIQYADIIKQSYQNIKNEAKTDDSFKNIINFILEFQKEKDINCQKQNKTDKIEKSQDNNHIPHSSCEKKYLYMLSNHMNNCRVVNCLSEYIEALLDFKKISGGERVWYRGICNDKFDLLPSIFREKALLSNKGGYTNVYSLLCSFIRELHYNTKTYNNIIEHFQDRAELVALMQHYGVPTNFLDFSTDPLSALYWALNPENEDDKNDTTSNAVVYLFYPMSYQKVVNNMKKWFGIRQDEFNNQIYPIRSFHCLDDHYIPLNTTDENIGNVSKVINNLENLYNFDPSKHDELLCSHYPIPTSIPQRNDRIRAQSGTFVAYDLYSFKDNSCNKAQPYYHFSLDEIQRVYLKIAEASGIEPIMFLRKINIANPYKEELRNQLDLVFEYNISKIYPDIQQLFNDTKNGVNEY